MKTIKGPAIFLAQFAGDQAPFNSLDAIAAWAAGLGYKGVQIPSWDERLFNLKTAAESKTYCDEVRGVMARHGLQITELSTHLQGQLVAVHPAYDQAFDGFAAPSVRGSPARRAHRFRHCASRVFDLDERPLVMLVIAECRCGRSRAARQHGAMHEHVFMFETGSTQHEQMAPVVGTNDGAL